nr:MAG TPA: N-deoxyribosyltransferase [Caudoviricetes sp.]
MKETVFIAGPMTGKSNYNFEAFDNAESYLKCLGYRVVNPANMGRTALEKHGEVPYGSPAYKELLAATMKAVTQSDCIYMLKGWENSRGAKQELSTAIDLDKTVMLEV